MSPLLTLFPPPTGPFNVRCNTVAFGYIETRLTQAKELGETIMVDGKAIALGIPGAGKNAQPASDRVPDIPLGRAGTAHEGAKAVLFLVSPLASYVSRRLFDPHSGSVDGMLTLGMARRCLDTRSR